MTRDLMNLKLLILLIFFLVFNPFLQAQEVLLPLQYNISKKQHHRDKDQSNPIQQKNDKSSHLSIPFKEDFSYPGPYPDTRFWSDSFAFVNTGFAVNPKSTGTATFDAIDQWGEIYGAADSLSFLFPADLLTSQPIRLDSIFGNNPTALSPSDSVMLSFHYQPQGNGSPPREKDSLVLQFLHTPAHWESDPSDPDENIWVEDQWENVWKATGKSLEDFLMNNDSTFFQFVGVMIEDEAYFRNDFRFRFQNYASFPQPNLKNPQNFAGISTIWNIDYIMLDRGRNKTDSFYYDITFAEKPQSLLQKYQAMPWKHYIQNPQDYLKARFEVKIANLDNTTYNYFYRYFIEDEQGSNVRNYSGGSWNISPFAESGFQNYQPHANPIVVPDPLPVNPADARQFTTYHVIREGLQGDLWPWNDTISRKQTFDNYFAYDDGTPENGYGLVGNSAKGAVRFLLGTEDLMDAVQIYFNPTFHEVNNKAFVIKVWKNLAPETILYESEVLFPDFQEGINHFITYEFEEPLLVSDTIYVGWQQTTSDFLHIGFDTSTDNSDQIFYNTTGEWTPSIFKGSLMLRPVFGEQVINNIPQHSGSNSTETLFVYPNPLKGQQLFIKNSDEGFMHEAEIIITDIAGKVVYRLSYSDEIDVSALANGIYFLQLNRGNNSKPAKGARFIIAR